MWMILRARVGGGGNVNSSFTVAELAVAVRRRLAPFFALGVRIDPDASEICRAAPGFEKPSRERVSGLLVMAGGGSEKGGSNDDD